MTKKIIITDPTAQIDAWAAQCKMRFCGSETDSAFACGELLALLRIMHLLEKSTHGEYTEFSEHVVGFQDEVSGD